MKDKVSENNLLLLKDIKVQFCKKDEMNIEASEYSLPIICNDFPTNFNEEDYFKVNIKHFCCNIIIICIIYFILLINNL